MTKLSFARMTSGAVVMATALLAPGAASAQKAADKMAEDRQTFRKSVVEIRDQIDRTLSALDQIVKGKDAASRKPSLKTFSSEREKMEKQIDKARDYADQLRERGQDYFKSWEKSMKGVSNPELKASATERRTALQAQYTAIENGIAKAKEVGPSFRKNLEDLQKYFAVDLSNEAIATSAKLVDSTTGDGKKIQESIDAVIAAVDQAGAKIEEKAAPEAAPEPSPSPH